MKRIKQHSEKCLIDLLTYDARCIVGQRRWDVAKNTDKWIDFDGHFNFMWWQVGELVHSTIRGDYDEQ